MRKRMVTAVLILLSSKVWAQTMTLQQCIDTAIKNNIAVRQSSLQSDAASVRLRQAKENLLPDLNGNASYGLNQGRNVDPLTNNYINQQLASSNVGLSSGLLLFNGMRLQNLIKQNNLSYNAAQMDLQQNKDNLTLNVILAYLQVLDNEDVLAISKAQVDVTQKQVDRMNILVNEGAAANYQLADLKGQQANEQLAIINAANALQQAKLSLCQLMNMDYNSNLQLEKTGVDLEVKNYTATSTEVYQSALQNFSLIKANNYKTLSAAKAVEVAKSGYYPSIRLTGNLGSSYSSLAQTLTPTNISEVSTGSYVIINSAQNPVLRQQQNYSSAKTGYTKQLNNNLGTFVGINVQVPLFNAFQTKNNVKLAQINYKTTQLDADNTKLLLKQNIEQAYLNMTSAYEKYAVLQEQVKDFEETFRAAEVRFNNGVINSTEYLISKNNLDRTRVNFTQAKYEYSFRVRVLDYFKK
ncbi:MAG: TolC family protein [Bacteroidetes bacterium]|nr:TolC family protein [Bacteroidota bacterium]